jgi:hypothetical protein
MDGLRSYIFLKRLADEAHVYLYCSEITAHILAMEETFAEVIHKIKALPAGVPSIVKIPNDSGPEEDVTVSVIPTGHCPGAVMCVCLSNHNFGGIFFLMINGITEIPVAQRWMLLLTVFR